MQAVPEPTRAHLGDLLHLRHMFGGMAKFVDNVRLGAVEHAKEDRLAALNDDAEDRGGNEQADDRVGKRVAEPHADRAEKHRQAGPAIDARVVPVRNQRRAVDLLTDANPEKRHRLIA